MKIISKAMLDLNRGAYPQKASTAHAVHRADNFSKSIGLNAFSTRSQGPIFLSLGEEADAKKIWWSSSLSSFALQMAHQREIILSQPIAGLHLKDILKAAGAAFYPMRINLLHEND